MKEVPTVLLVEDDFDSRAAIVVMLEALGLSTVAFAEGNSAVAFAKERGDKRIDVVLLDVMLPGKDGYEVMRELKQFPATATSPVIMVTARDAESDVIEGYRFGADYYITKPFTAKQLQQGIELYLKPGGLEG